MTDNDGKAIDSVLSGKSGQSTAQKVIDSSLIRTRLGQRHNFQIVLQVKCVLWVFQGKDIIYGIHFSYSSSCGACSV